MKRNKYILCIDDDEDDLSLIAEVITNEDPSYTMVFKKSGDEAVPFLINAIRKNNLPDLIVLDINMPGMDGQETLLEIQKLLGTAYVPILFLSTNPSPYDMELAESRNVTVFTKPNSMKGYDDISKTIFTTLLKQD